MSENEASESRVPLDVSTVLAVMLDQMAMVAWQKLGLQHDPVTNSLAKDLSQARVAIDVVSDLAKHLEPSLDEDDRRQIQNLVRDLRVNYVEHSKSERIE